MKRRDFLGATLSMAGLAACDNNGVKAPSGQGNVHAREGSTEETADLLSDEDHLDTVMLEIAALANTDVQVLLDESSQITTRSEILPNAMTPTFSVPPVSEALRLRLSGRKYSLLEQSEKPLPVWPEPNRAPDYLHLTGFGNPASNFTISSDHLRTLAARNSFEIRRSDPVVVFGLRGCNLEDGASEATWSPEHKVSLSTPNHLELRCLIGLWRQGDGQIALFKSATVPSAQNIYMVLSEQGAGTSLLPTGLYNLRRGNHKASKPARVQRGALIMQDEYAVLRTAAELTYDPFLPTTAWTRGAAHNIHAAGLSRDFDSAGCQVIEGTYLKPTRLRAQGAWDTFRRYAGTVDAAGAEPPSTDQALFQYMLLTGQELALVDQGGERFGQEYQPLRFGSSGVRVAALEDLLISKHSKKVSGIKASGRFDMLTTFGVLIENKPKLGDFGSHISF